MSEFRFKRFTVKNEDSPMKVGTDGVLLGAAVRLLGNERNIADVGTGTGVIALMLAQKTSVATRIVGIEIDAAAAAEADVNFRRSPWAERLRVEACALQTFDSPEGYDLIVSNPPYFDNSLQNPDARRSEARHSVSLGYRELIEFAERKLTPQGRLAMILPSDCRAALLREARGHCLYADRIMNISSTERKGVCRIIVEFSRQRRDTIQEENLTIYDGNGYSREYLQLTHDFYLFA